MVLVATVAGGCTRRHYRQQADRVAYSAVSDYQNEPRSPLPNFTINLRPESRLFDPFDPDRPPLPPDDPHAHELMHRVDGKRGYARWHRDGDAPAVDMAIWRQYLPENESGEVVLDVDGAVQIALLHSRNYQKELEDLYLSALDVTFERFRFNAQFFGGNSTFMNGDGPRRPGGGGQSSTLLTSTDTLEMHRLFAGGGQLVVDLANSLVWQFAGPDTNSNTTLLSFSLVQPLLRFGGRARIMERLTLSERTLLYNVRQMEHYRRGFYAQVLTGRDPGQGPARRGGVFGGSGFDGFSGVGGGGFGRVGTVISAPSSTGAGAADAGGYYGLLQDQQQIRNLSANVAALADSLAQLQAGYDAGRIDRFQIELARQALYNGQSRLLALRAAYETAQDNFKVSAGLPPNLPIKVQDPLLDRFNLLDPQMTALQEKAGALLDRARNPGDMPDPELVSELLAAAKPLQKAVDEHLGIVDRDYEALVEHLPTRQETLRELAKRPELADGQIDLGPYSAEGLEQRVKQLRTDIADLKKRFAATWSGLEALQSQPGANPDMNRMEFIRLATDLSGELLELSLYQAKARLDTIELAPVDLAPEEAIEIARAFRRDWQNARGALVDTWRLITFNANALRSGLDVTLAGDVSSVDNNPLDFRGSAGRVRAGLAFDAPLTRVAERNIFRQSLIEYQQSRRSYMQFEDAVYQSLRLGLRTIRVNQINFELRRAAVHVAITEVDLTRLKLNKPPKPGETAELGVTTARDLLSAFTDLLNAQNDFLSVWVNFEVLRLGLDYELGTMELDDRGLWVDPGAIRGGRTVEPAAEPLPPGVPLEMELIPPMAHAADGNSEHAVIKDVVAIGPEE